MRVLIIHPNFPGQFKHIARALAQDPNNEVVFACNPKEGVENIPGVKRIEYKAKRDASPKTHRYIIGLERGILAGQAMWSVCDTLRGQGFEPDVILAHPGWGDALFVKDYFQDVPLLSFMEFYYHAFGADVHFDPNEPVNPDDVARIRIKNAMNLLNLEACDWALSPTWWQWQQHPQEFRHKFSVMHDGIDTNLIRPQKKNQLTLPNGKKLQQGDEIVTYVARNFEPYRGFPTVMKAIDLVTKRRPNCHVVIVGSDGVSYGRQPQNGKTYRQSIMEELDLDLSRVHFVGHLPHPQLISVYHYSRAHIYSTVPFVLSWSMLEAMAAGCVVVGSATPPVMEVIQDGKNGLLADFFSAEHMAERVCEALEKDMQPIREAARQTILDHYALDKVLPLYTGLVKDLAARRFPPPTAQAIQQFNPAPVAFKQQEAA